MAEIEARIENGWTLYGHPFFIFRLEELVTEVEELMALDPDGFHHHPIYKLWECVDHQILVGVPRDPGDKLFNQGNTLGLKNRHWRRVKKGLPQRYRLFFQFRSSAPKTIIYAWLNDDRTLRKDGDRSDVYAVFAKMLSSRKMPGSFQELLDSANPIEKAR
ncbi:type II toxin-antitoxin system YhaV family toxin [Pseudomonas solani]|uniref:type II toxin-antitoxin system YhaV family toxin n=1 Tax=Pseudomonas solani TaxID=2731552 RepID=UPI0017AFD4AA|nr:toxin YhaV [Pseudomonas alcaligenes]